MDADRGRRGRRTLDHIRTIRPSLRRACGGSRGQTIDRRPACDRRPLRPLRRGAGRGRRRGRGGAASPRTDGSTARSSGFTRARRACANSRRGSPSPSGGERNSVTPSATFASTSPAIAAARGAIFLTSPRSQASASFFRPASTIANSEGLAASGCSPAGSSEWTEAFRSRERSRRQKAPVRRRVRIHADKSSFRPTRVGVLAQRLST